MDPVNWEITTSSEELTLVPTTVFVMSLDVLCDNHPHPPKHGHTHSLVIKTAAKISIVFTEHSEKKQDQSSVSLFCNFEVISI